jgi:hypothetical protein
MISLTPAWCRARKRPLALYFLMPARNAVSEFSSVTSEFGWVVGIEVCGPDGTAQWTRRR